MRESQIKRKSFGFPLEFHVPDHHRSGLALRRQPVFSAQVIPREEIERLIRQVYLSGGARYLLDD